jgi:hypothetical protein
MPDHWDTQPENLFSVPGEQPDPAPTATTTTPTTYSSGTPAAASGSPPIS